MKNIILNDDVANNLVKEKLKNNEKFAVCRVGCGFETIVTNQILNGLQVTDQQLYFLSIQAGFYGNCLMDFYEEYSKGISAADFQVVWQGSMIDHLQENLFGKLSPYSEKISFKVVEPYYFDEPWSESLKNKKVLIINPFSQSIRYQYKKREKLWQNPNILPEFDLKTYATVQSVGGKGPHSSWIESLNFMKDEISEIDFDIALLGCGSYGLPLVNFIKNKMNKTAIYVGGAVQIIFGIKGKRWDENQSINKFYNEFWKRPFDIETPDKASMVEGGCYW
jgi:hypothetical protein